MTYRKIVYVILLYIYTYLIVIYIEGFSSAFAPSGQCPNPANPLIPHAKLDTDGWQSDVIASIAQLWGNAQPRRGCAPVCNAAVRVGALLALPMTVIGSNSLMSKGSLICVGWQSYVFTMAAFLPLGAQLRRSYVRGRSRTEY